MGKSLIKTVFLSCSVCILIWACTPSREVDNGTRGVASTASPEATQTAMEVFAAGGNAADAAVAISFVLGVTEPAMSGLGGGTQVLLAAPGKDPIMINGTTFSPRATPSEMRENTLSFHRRSTIPSTVKVMNHLWKKYGSGKLSWAKLLEPAISYAEDGFAIGKFRQLVYQRHENALLDSQFGTDYFLINGRIPQEGEILKQPGLAKTLRRLAEAGAEDFYHGEIAKAIAEDMANNGGWITLEDLTNFPEPKEAPALHTAYNDLEVFTSTPPCGGWLMLNALNMMSRIKEDSHLQHDVPTSLKRLLALRSAHNMRRAVPVYDHVNYQSEIETRLSEDFLDSMYQVQIRPELEQTGGETTHFSVVDEHGMALAVTASINAYFGAKAASPKLGFLYNTYMDDFIFGDSTHPYAIGPGKMAYSSMTPTIVRRDGETVLVLGSPGSARIISAVSQVIWNWSDLKLSISEAVAAPRVHGIGSNVYLESVRDSLALASDLHKMKLTIRGVRQDLTINRLNAYFGGIHAIAKESGSWIGVADPRRDGVATSSYD